MSELRKAEAFVTHICRLSCNSYLLGFLWERRDFSAINCKGKAELTLALASWNQGCRASRYLWVGTLPWLPAGDWGEGRVNVCGAQGCPGLSLSVLG